MVDIEEFIKIYNEIHEYMKDIMNVNNHRSFSRLIGESKKVDYTIKNYQEYLIKFAQIRNMIVHENEIFAVPNENAFSLIKQIRDKLYDPPGVFPMFRKEVKTINQKESVIKAIALMKENHFSKIPLVDDSKRFKGLLTDNAILSWLGSSKLGENNRIVLEDTQAQAILRHRDKNNVFSFIAADTKLIEVIEKYDSMHRRGQRLEAFLISEDGSREQKITGIITNRDMGLIYSELDLLE